MVLTGQKAAIYARISRDRYDTALGVDRQKRLCRKLVTERGWTVVDTYVDNDVSATGRRPRPEYERLKADLAACTFDVIIALDSDRLLRRPLELEHLLELCEDHGVRVVYSSGGFDTATGEGVMEARIRAAVDAEEVAKLKKRVKRKAEELAANGQPNGGERPFGYDKGGLVIRESEAEHIRDAAARIIAGESARSIVRDWNANGITTSRGGTWAQSCLRRVLISGRIAGRRFHCGEDVADAVWPAVVDLATWNRVRAVFLDPARLKNNGAMARRYLLTGGVARCGLCGAKLVARPRGDKRRCYVCATGPGFGGCGKIRQLAEPLEALVVEAVIHRLDSPVVHEAIDPSDPDEDRAAVAEIEAVDARLEELANSYAADEITMREWQVARSGLEARRAAAAKQLAVRKGGDVLASITDNLAGEWDELPIEKQRAIVGALVGAVTVGPAVKGRNFFDADRVDVSWRA